MQTRYLRALIVVFFVTGITSVTFFVSNRLSSSQNVAPNAPESKPFALQRARIPDEDINPPTNQSPVVKPKKTAKTTDYLEEEELEFIRRLNSNNNSSNPVSTPKPSQSPQSPSGNNSNNGSGSPATTTIPTPKPDTFGAQGSSDDPNSYKSKDKNPCEDGLGFVSGTGCFKNQETGKYERRVLSLPETQRAYQEHIDKVKDKILTASDAQLIDLAFKDSTNKCPKEDTLCNIQFGQDKLLQQNLIIDLDSKELLTTARKTNQVTQDVINLTPEQLEDKYNTTNISKILNNNNIADPDLAKAGAILSAYNNSKTPAKDMVEIICGQDRICKDDLRYDSLEELLKLGTGKKVPSEVVDVIIKTKKDETKAQKYIDLYLDQRLSDKDKIDIYCKENGIDINLCRKNIEVDDLARYAGNPQYYIDLKLDYSNQRIITDPNNDLTDLAKIYCRGNTTTCTVETILDKIGNPEVKKITSDQFLAKLYSDPTNSISELANIHCKNNHACRENFTKEYFLSQITNPEIKNSAQINRNLALSALIPNVVNGVPTTGTGIDVDTKKEIIKLNEDTTYAFWVYVRENAARQHGSQNVTTEQLALEFNEKIKKDPSLLTKNISTYNETPKKYEMSFTTFKFDKEENPLLIAQYNQILKTQTIAGLANNGKAVIWDNADPLYKLQAMAKACQSGESALTANECRSINNTLKNVGNINNPSAEDKKVITTFTNTVLAEKFGDSNKSQLYLQEVFDNTAKSNLLSVTQSNLATIDNPALGDPTLQAEIKKANNAADVADIKNQMTYNTITYGDGMGMAPIIVPTTYKGNNTKLTEEEKAEIANEYLRRQVVVETYTRGAGVGGALLTAGAATALCAAYGGPLGVAAAPVCGAAGGLAGVVSNIIPILGTATAEEIEAERQYWAQKTDNDFAGTFIQAMYTNQGASSDEAFLGGRSQSNLDNQYALLDRIHEINAQTGATTQSFSDPTYQAQIALQPFILEQGELLQQENAQQQYVNIASSLVVGGISGGVGGSLAEKAFTQTSNTLGTVFRSTGNEIAMWAGGAVINAAQTQYQFSSTADFIDTELEIKLEKCKKEKGLDNCDEEIIAVADERITLNNSALQQAIITDAIIQTGQTATSFSTSLYGYFRPSANSNTPRPATQANLDEAINNLISTSQPIARDTTPFVLKPEVDDAISLIARNVAESSQTELVNSIRSLNNLDNTEKQMLVYATENTSYRDYLADPNPENLNRLVTDVKETTNILNGGNDVSPEPYLETLISLHNKLQDTGLPESHVNTLLATVKTELGTQNDSSLKINTTANDTSTQVDPFTEATQRLLNQRARQNNDLTIEELNTLLEGIPLTEERVNALHDLQNNPEFQESANRIARTIVESEKTRETLTKSGTPTDNYDEAIQTMLFDLTAELAQNFSAPTNISQANPNQTTFRPEDDIKQTMPGNEKNTIGKIPSKTIEIKGQQEQVYYRISYLESGKVTATEIHPLTDTNTLPTDKPFLLEFGIKKDPSSNIGDDNFIAINDDNINPSRGTQKLAMNISNEYTFGDQDVVSNAPAQPNTPPRPALTDAQRNQYAAMYLNERNKYRDSGMSNAEYRNTVDQLNNDYRQLGIDIENDLPNGYGPIRSALVSFWNRLFDPGTPEEPYNRFFFQRQQQNTSQDTNTPPSPPIKVLERTPLPKVDLDNAISKIDQPPLSSEQTARRLAALKDATSKYTVSDDNLPQFLKNLGYSDDEINYALRTRQYQEIQEIIRELKLHDTRAEEDMNNALKQILDQGPLFADEVKLLEQNLNSQRQSLLDNQFEKANGAIANIQDETLNRIDSNLPEVFPTQITEPLPNTTQSIPQSTANSIRNSINMIIDKIKKQLRKINEVGGIRTSGVKSGANTNTVTGPMGITLLVPKKNGPLDTAKLVPLLREHIPLIEENKMIDLARALTQRGVTESELDTLMTTARYLHTSGSTRLFLGIDNYNIVESLTPDIKPLTLNTGISEEQLKFVLREYLNNPNRDSTIISLIRSNTKEKVSRATYLSNTEITAILKMIESGQLDKILQTATDIQTKLGLNQKPIPMPTTYQTDDTPNAIPTTMPNDSPDIFALTQYAIELATSPTPKNPTDFLLEQNMSPEIIDNHLRLVSSTDFSEIVTLARQIADSNADRIVSQSQFLNDMRNSTTDDVLATFAQELHGELLNEVATRINDIASKYFDTSNIVTSNGVAHRPQDLLRAAATIKKTSPNQQPPMNLSLYTTQEIDIIFRLVASEEKTVIETLNNVDTDTSPITTSDAQSTIKKAVDSTTFIPKIDNEENSSPQATTALTKKRTIFSRLKSITYPISDVIAKIRAKLKPNQSQTTTSASRLGIFDPISPKIDATYRQNVLNSQLPDLTTPPNRNYNTNNSQAPDIVSNISENIKGTIDKGRATKYWGIDTHDNRSGKVYTNSEALERVTILGENLSALKFLEEQAVSLSSTDQKIYGKESTTNREILINELILTKENTIAKRLGIPLENIHFLSNEDLALVMTSFHRLVDGQLELVSVDQNGNITYRNKSTKESFVLGPEWPDTRIINKIFAKQQYSALADQDVTKLYYKYLQDSQYNISVIEDKIITPVSGTKRLNYNNEKYFDINTGKYTNTESPYTRIVLDDLGNISENIYFESPMILSNKRSSFFSELNLATKNKSSNRTYSKDDLIELINQRVITLDEANKYATAINKPQITATDLAPQDIFPSTMPTEDSPDTPNPPTTSLTNHQKELFLIENGFKQNLTEMTIRPLLESYQRWKNLGYSDQDIMVDFPKMVAVHNPKYVLENAFHVTKDTTYSEYLAQFNDLAEYTIVTDLWIYGHVDVENNPIPGIIELVSKQTPASVIQKYFNFKNEPPTTADAFVEFAYNPKRLLDEKEYQKNYSEYVEHTRTLSKGDPEYSDDFDELWVLAHINGEKTPATGVDVLRLKGTPETTISKYIDPNNPQKKPLIIDKTASLESIYPPIAKSLKENTKENNILNRNSTKAIRKILLHKTETNATIREKIRYAIQKSGISEFISEKTFPLSVRLETFELYLGDFIDQNLSRKQILEIDMAIRLAKLYTNESTSEIVSRLPERYQKTIQKLQTALDKYKAAWNEDDYGSLPFKLQSRSEKWQTIKNRTIISTIMTTGSYLISTLSEGNDKNSENYESLNYLLPESLSSPAPTPTPTTTNNQQNTLPTPTQTPTQTAQLPPITLNRPNQEASSLNVAIDRCMDIVGVETNGNGDLRENYGQQMATCFCTNAEGGCNEGNANQQISEILLNIYNRNLLYGYTDQAFYPILEILYNVSLSSPNVCNQNRICDTNNTEKFATCQVGKASDIYPTDIIFDNDNNPHICPQSWSANNDTVSCNASFTTTGISDNTQTIEVKNIKKIWRTDSYKTSSCWQ